MFITCANSGYTRDGEQFTHGLFLMVFTDPMRESSLRPELRALVRFVKMKQCGHWMMADVKLGKYSICLSGSYGSDGLPMSLGQHFCGWEENGKSIFAQFTEDEKKKLWEQFVPIPQELQNAFWEGGGHNTCGKEAPSFRKWAKENEKILRKPIAKS